MLLLQRAGQIQYHRCKVTINRVYCTIGRNILDKEGSGINPNKQPINRNKLDIKHVTMWRYSCNIFYVRVLVLTQGTGMARTIHSRCQERCAQSHTKILQILPYISNKLATTQTWYHLPWQGYCHLHWSLCCPFGKKLRIVGTERLTLLLSKNEWRVLK